MPWLRSRVVRVRGYERLILGFVATVTTLAGVATLFADRFGFVGIAVFALIFGGGVIGVLVMPEWLWLRLSGMDTTADDLGRLHEQGVELRGALPWVTDVAGEAELEAYQTQIEAWATRVHGQLAPRWRGVFLSDVTGFRTSTSGFKRASRMRNWLDDRLERLSQIMAAIGGAK